MNDHDWNDRLRMGRRGEARIYRAAVEDWGFVAVRPAPRHLDLAGIDAYFIRRDGTSATVQVKTCERAQDTGNIAYETVSKLETGAPGAMVKCCAEFFLYYIKATGEVLLFNSKKLASMRKEWEARYEHRDVSTNRKQWTTRNILVPLGEARRIAEKTLTVVP